MASSDNHLQLSPTTSYYLRKLLRQNLDCLQSILFSDADKKVDPLTDLNSTLKLLYLETSKVNGAVQDLERLAKYHQVLSNQGSLHRQELEKTEQDIFAALGFKVRRGDGEENKAQILIVDDRPENIRLLSVALNRQGYAVESVDNSTMALSLTRRLKPDLILLDIMMPVMDGYEVCQHLKADAETCDIPIIFVSAVTSVTDKVKGFRAGAVDYITKPFQFDEVLARVEHQLRIQNLRQRLEDQNVRLQQEIRDRQQEGALLRLLQGTLDRLSQYHFFCDADGRLTQVSESTSTTLEYSREELLGMTLQDLDPGFEQEAWPTHWIRLRENNHLILRGQHKSKSGISWPIQLNFTYLTINEQTCSHVAVYRVSEE